MKKILIPVAVLMMGAGAAYATKAVNSSPRAEVTGYRIVDQGGGQFSCESTPKTCVTENISQVIGWNDGTATYNLHQLSGTMCANELYEKP